MAENKWVSLGFFHPTYRGPIAPIMTGSGAHLVEIVTNDSSQLPHPAIFQWGPMMADEGGMMVD